MSSNSTFSSHREEHLPVLVRSARFYPPHPHQVRFTQRHNPGPSIHQLENQAHDYQFEMIYFRRRMQMRTMIKAFFSLRTDPLPCPLQSENISANTLFVPSVTGSCGCLVMILFASEVKIHHLSEKIANYKEGTYAYKTQSEKYTTSFWVVFICFFVHFLNGLLIRLAGFQFPFAKSKNTETTNVAADLMY